MTAGTWTVLPRGISHILRNKLNDKPYLIIIQGASGSGKTTQAKLISENFNFPYFEADQYFTDALGNYKWNPRKLGEAHKQCYDNVVEHLSNGKSCIVSNTFTKDVDLQRYLNIEVDFIPYIIRMNSRYQNVHRVPDEMVERMRQSLDKMTIEPDIYIH